MQVFDWLTKRTDLSPHKTALVDTATGREFTYEQFNDRASRAAEFLRDELQAMPGDRVAILAYNSTDYFELLYGCAKIGAILVPLNWRLAVPELRFILDDCTPDVLIYDPAFAETVDRLRSDTDIAHYVTFADQPPAGEWAYEQALADASGRPIKMEARDPNDVWHILYTSGTTGRPKGVLQTFNMVLYNYLNIGLPISLTSEDTSLNVLPCFHTGGLNLYANPTIIAGGTAMIQRIFEPEETLRLLEERTTVFFGVPAIYLFLSQHPNFEDADLSGVRSWASGGAPLPVSTIETYAERSITIRQGFGMTETGPTVFLIDEEHALTKAGSVGKTQMFVDVRIVDRHGDDVPQGEMGELLIKGPAVTPGYWQLPDMTADAIEDDGWLHSGDVARCDDDGYYYIVDRWKDMFISGGENVYPAEVENVLYDHPAVGEVAVIGVPNKKWGEVGKAIVVLAAGETSTEAELLAFCQGRLARYKIPKSVEFVNELPRNAAGKVRKVELREEYACS